MHIFPHPSSNSKLHMAGKWVRSPSHIKSPPQHIFLNVGINWLSPLFYIRTREEKEIVDSIKFWDSLSRRVFIKLTAQGEETFIYFIHYFTSQVRIRRSLGSVQTGNGFISNPINLLQLVIVGVSGKGLKGSGIRNPQHVQKLWWWGFVYT